MAYKYFITTAKLTLNHISEYSAKKINPLTCVALEPCSRLISFQNKYIFHFFIHLQTVRLYSIIIYFLIFCLALWPDTQITTACALIYIDITQGGLSLSHPTITEISQGYFPIWNLHFRSTRILAKRECFRQQGARFTQLVVTFSRQNFRTEEREWTQRVKKKNIWQRYSLFVCVSSEVLE